MPGGENFSPKELALCHAAEALVDQVGAEMFAALAVKSKTEIKKGVLNPRDSFYLIFPLLIEIQRSMPTFRLARLTSRVLVRVLKQLQSSAECFLVQVLGGKMVMKVFNWR